MAFNPEQIRRIGLGSVDYPRGEAVLGQYGWHVLELVLDQAGHWNDDVVQTNFMYAAPSEMISMLSRNFDLEFEIETSWDEFRQYLDQFGKVGKDITGSFNGQDFEDLMS
jgi:hypothetical protein